MYIELPAGLLGVALLAVACKQATTPSVTPQSSKIAFASLRDGNYEIYVMNADGSAQARLTNDGAVDLEPAWSPDGSKIAFTRGSDIFVMNPDGSAAAQLGRRALVSALRR